METPGAANLPPRTWATLGRSLSVPGAASLPPSISAGLSLRGRSAKAPRVVRLQRALRVVGADLWHGPAFLLGVLSPPFPLVSLFTCAGYTVPRPRRVTALPAWHGAFAGVTVPVPEIRRACPGVVQAGWQSPTAQRLLLGAEKVLERCKSQLLTWANPALLCRLLYGCAWGHLPHACF